MNVNLRRELGASRALDGRLDVNWRRLEPAALGRTWRNPGEIRELLGDGPQTYQRWFAPS